MLGEITKNKIDKSSLDRKDKELLKARGLYVSKNLHTNEEELIVDINGVKGKINSKDLEIKQREKKDINTYVGKIFEVTISSVDNNVIYCSRKEAQREILGSKLALGKKLKAKISKITEDGIIITLYQEMISTFIKKEDLIGKGIKISELYEVGDYIYVIVNQIIGEELIVKPIEKYDSNEKALKALEEGEIISGYIISSHVDKVFVRIAPGIDVLCRPEEGLNINDKVDIEMTKVSLKENIVRGKIINFKKLNEYIGNLKVGEIVNGVVKKIEGNKYHVKIRAGIYIKCEVDLNKKISMGDEVKVKISRIDTKTKDLSGSYIDTKKLKDILGKANKGDIIGGTIKNKINLHYEVITNTGLSVLCKIIDNSLQIGDYVFSEIVFVKENPLTIFGLIIDTNKRDKYLQQRYIGEELKGVVIDTKDNICIVKVSIGVKMICPLSKNVKIAKDDSVMVKIDEIDRDFSILYGQIIENIVIEQEDPRNIELENLYDYKIPFVIYGFDKPKFTNQGNNINRNAIEEIVKQGRISEIDKCIVRFLIDSRFASMNQIHRFLLTNKNIYDENITDLKDRIQKLVKYRVINSFRIKDKYKVIYCLDIGGKYILDKEENKKSKEWTNKRVNKGWNIIGKALVSTEIYIKLREKYLGSNIEFSASPYIYKDVDSKKSKQVVFTMKIKNRNHKASILGEVYRKDDISITFDKRMSYIEEYLSNGLWENEFKDYGRPKVVIVVENEERLLWVSEKLSTYHPNVMKDYIITTDSRLDEDILVF